MCGVYYSNVHYAFITDNWQSYRHGTKMKPGIYVGASLGTSNNLNKKDVCFTFNMSANFLAVLANGEDVGTEQGIGGNFKLQPGFWLKRFYVGLDGVFEFAGASVHCGGALLKVGYRY